MTRIYSNLSSELNTELTRQSKTIGYRRSDVLAYFADNPEFTGGLCNELLASDDLISYLDQTVGINMYSNTITITLNTDNSLRNVLRKYHVNISTFLLFIIKENIVVSRMSSLLPPEQKLKKYTR